MFLLDSGEFLFEYFHGLIESVGVFLWIIDDFKKRSDERRDILELFLSEFTLFVEVLNRLSAVLHVHGDEILVAAH